MGSNKHAEQPEGHGTPLLKEQELRYVVLMCERKAWLQKELPLKMNLSKKQVARIQQDVFAALGVHSHHELIYRAVELGLVPCPCMLHPQAGGTTLKSV